MRIKIDKADRKFSQYIRTRDRKCMRCWSIVEFNDKELPVSHQCSHYFGRGKEGTRFEPDNCDTLCYGCHQEWGSDNRESYREFKIEQLGEKRLKTLEMQATLYHKKDRKLAYLISKKLLEEELNNKTTGDSKNNFRIL